ncbi:hypothetical protein P171DRAFT_504414 [Karstenula rhodostoma CBS 690.94]|uniref:SRR1-like domain-containing protein n=1 Tax=Karstenula rhodostoma CBS 690.94 TaxID=1392251 RepID=A0A9P4P5T9_9PLEO|nr:hypothetical protein P171DRAFT_504414 [Karstenula rhodostoma CBS 690.94]
MAYRQDWKTPISAAVHQMEELYDKLGHNRLYSKENIKFVQQQLYTIHNVEELQKASPPENPIQLEVSGSKYKLELSRSNTSAEVETNFRSCQTDITMTFMDAFGKEHRFIVPPFYWMYPPSQTYAKPGIAFLPYQAIPHPPFRSWLNDSMCNFGNSYNSRPIIPKDPEITPRKCPLGSWRSLALNYIPMYYHPNRSFEDGEHMLKIKRAINMRDDSKLERKAILKAMSELEVPVKKIICFDLGSMRFATSNIGTEFFLHQHYTALDLAHHLDAAIIFQDPDYDDDDKEFLISLAKQSNINVKFLEPPGGLLEIDESTLIFTTGRPTIPIKQLVADLTHEYRGPAGVFFEDISPWTSAGVHQEEWTMENEVMQFYSSDDALTDPLNKHVVNMLKNFKEVFNTDSWYEKIKQQDKHGNMYPYRAFNDSASLYLKRKVT